MTADAFRRAIAVYPALLRAAYGDQPVTLAPADALGLLALLDLAEAEITTEAAPPIRTAWDPVLTDEELDYVMPAEPVRHAIPRTRTTADGAEVRRALEPQVSRIRTAARLADEIERARHLARAG